MFRSEELTEHEPAARETVATDLRYERRFLVDAEGVEVRTSVKSAGADKTAAFAYQLPVASFAGDYGDIGTTPGHSHGTFTATGRCRRRSSARSTRPTPPAAISWPRA